tara:strand:- start:801 stop:1205 length:405 start_codon:yes stop_codon:yes gene_type:complete
VERLRRIKRMKELLELIGKKKTVEILSHPNFPEGVNELIRDDYVIVKDENFFLTSKGERARKEGYISEPEKEDPVQLKRNNLNKSITALPPNFSKKPKSILILILAFLIFMSKFLPLEKIFRSKYNFRWWKNKH